MKHTVKMALKEQLLKLIEDLDNNKLEIQAKALITDSTIIINDTAYKLSPKKKVLTKQFYKELGFEFILSYYKEKELGKQFHKDLGFKFIPPLDSKEEFYKMEYNEIYKYDTKAIITKIGFVNVVMLPMEVLFKFDLDDRFVVGPDSSTIWKGWGGNTVSSNPNDQSFAGSGGPVRLKVSKCIYLGTKYNNINFEDQVIHLLKEYNHRCFHTYKKDFTGQGVTYGNRDCNCFVCKRETERIQMEPELKKVLIQQIRHYGTTIDGQEVHYIPVSFLNSNKTLCGKELKSDKYVCTEVNELSVTCKKCIDRSLLNSKYR